MVYYGYELRWSSSDNTLKEPDASGSFSFIFFTFFPVLFVNIFVFTEESVRYMQLLLLSILMRKVIPMLSRISQ